MASVVALLSGTMLWGIAWWPIQVLDAEGLDAVSLTLAANGTAALVLAYPAMRLWPEIWRSRRVLLAIAIGGACWNLGFVGSMAEGEAGRRVLLYYLSSSWSILGGRIFLTAWPSSPAWPTQPPTSSSAMPRRCRSVARTERSSWGALLLRR